MSLCIFFGRSVLIQTIRNIENGQIFVQLREVHSFYLNKQLLAVLANESVIVLILHVHYEVEIVIDGGARDGTDGVDFDCALELFLFNVGKSVRGQKKVPLLLHSKAIELQHFGTVYERLCKLVGHLPFFSSWHMMA